MALLATLAAVSVPVFGAAAERVRTRAAARATMARLALMRAQAVSRGAVVALRVEGLPQSASLVSYVDGNRNGVLTADIAAGVDLPDGAPLRLDEEFRGVRVSLLAGSPSTYSFSPTGTSSSGTLVFDGGGARYGVRVLGSTGRSRLLRFVDATSTWENEP